MAYVGAPLVKADFSSEITVSGDVTVDTNVLVVDTTNNRVGIGTSSPANILEVSGASPVLEIDAQTGNPELQFSDGGTDEFSIQYDTGSNALRFVEGGIGAQVVIKDGGNVGIGTTSPSEKIHIKRSGATGVYLRFEDSTGSAYAGTDSGHLQFFSGGANERMRITSGGNVLVGKTADDNGTAGIRLVSDGHASFSRSAASTAIFNRKTSDGHIVNFRKNQADVGHIGASGGDLYINGSSDLAFRVGDDEKARIDSSGRLGIGTTSPDEALHVASAGKIKASRSDNARAMLLYTDNNAATVESDFDPLKLKSADRIAFEANGSERMRITSGGNVGIGTTTPSVPLHVVKSGSGKQELMRVQAKDAGSHALYLYVDDTNNHVYYKSSGSQGGTHIWETGNTEIMRLDTSGRLGIGTTSPSTALDVSGTVTADGVSLGDNQKAQFGAGNDLEIFHDGANSYVKDVGTGSLYLQGTDLRLRANNANTYVSCVQGGAVGLRHNNSEKLTTTSTGVSVTGAVIGSTDVRAQGSGNSYAMLTTNENGGELQLGTTTDGYRASVDIMDTDNDGEGHFRLLNLSQASTVTEIGNAHASNAGQFKIKTANVDRLIINGNGSWGKAPAGTIIQVVTAQSSTAVTVNSTTYTTIISASITPRNADSRFLLIYSGNRDNTSNNYAWNWFTFYRNGTQVGVISLDQSQAGGLGYNSQVAHQIVDDNPNTASAITYSFRAKQGAGTTVWGESSSGNSLTILEIAG